MNPDSVGESAGTRGERRKGDELLPEVIALIASCGDEVRQSDRSALPEWFADRGDGSRAGPARRRPVAPTTTEK